jgi:arylsulfatase A-like enzyme/cytochrome c-type biogenesis protein CcmH/NrfG
VRPGLRVLAAGAVLVTLWVAREPLLRMWRRSHAPPNVLLISIDTLRADHVGAYGYAAAQTPALDGLAARGLRFVRASTTTPLTLPAHTSLMTGTFPAWHGVRDNGGFYVGEDQLTLAKVLRQHGYRTGGFVGAFVLDSRWGINQGFDRYFDNFDLSRYEGKGLDAVQRPGREVVDQALPWLDEEPGRPFFAWVHLYDPHTPYAAPEPFRSRFPVSIVGAYDAEIAYADSQVARLLDHLRERGALESTLVIAVGDHGESLGEHQEQQHGFFVYEGTVRIPLIIAGPGVPARVVADQVRIVDVMPTVLDAVGIPVPGTVQGHSLRTLENGSHRDLLALSETFYPRYHYGWSDLQAVGDGRYKFILAPERELYDLQDDPGETQNLASANPQRADALERALRDLQTRSSRSAAAAAPRPVDPEAEERLRALGYIGGSVSPRNLDDRPRGDPKRTIRLYNLLKLAAQDSVDGNVDAGIEKVRRALDDDPDIVEGYTMLGNLQTKAHRLDEAVGAYQHALNLDPEHQGAIFSLAVAYKQMGRLADAQAGFERARTLDPKSGKADWQIADIMMQRGDAAAAASLLETALKEKRVDRPSFLIKLAEADIQQQRYDEAEQRLRDAIAERTDAALAHYDLGLIAEARSDPGRAIAEYEIECRRAKPSYRASYNLARLLQRAGRSQEAIVHFRNAVAANPQFGTGFLYLAKALLDTGDLGASEEAARKGIAANPDRTVAPLGHYVLADVYTRQGRDREAAQQIAIGRRMERGGE